MISSSLIIIWVAGLKSGGEGWYVFYLFEVCILNAFVLEGYVQPELHANKGRKKRDILSFRLELAHELISGFFPREVVLEVKRVHN